jgi:hypothetical protein
MGEVYTEITLINNGDRIAARVLAFTLITKPDTENPNLERRAS